MKPTKILKTKNIASWRLDTCSDLIRAGTGVRSPPLLHIGSLLAGPELQGGMLSSEHTRIRTFIKWKTIPGSRARGLIGRWVHRTPVSSSFYNLVIWLRRDIGPDKIRNVLFSGLLTVY